jgi:hypothetical protein
MNRRHLTGRVAGPGAVLAVAGLLIAGCGSNSPSGSGGSGGSGGTQANTSATTSGGSGGSAGPGGGSVAGSALFPIAAGERWVYVSHLGGGSSTIVNTIKSIKPVSGGNLVTMTDSSDIDGVAKNTKISYVFYSNGSISVPLTQFGSDVTIKSGSIVWPSLATIASGQPHTSVLVFSIKANGQVINERMHVTVQGGGTQSVTVPAGTYQATVVNQKMAESLYGHKGSFDVRTWLAPNVGPVKTELLGALGALSGSGATTTQELKSFTK